MDVTQQFLKKYGKYYRADGPPTLKRLSTGILGLDYILGGGLPLGRILEIFANPSCGKTTISLQVAAHLLKQGHMVGYIDLEQAVYKEYAVHLHATHSNFHFFTPTNGKQAIEMIIDLASAGAKFIIVDSVPFLVPESVQEAEVGHINIAPQARLISAEQSKIVDAAAMNESVVWFINQCRAKLGGYVVTTDSCGGNALKFMCSVRMHLYRKEELQGKIGYKGLIKTIKNKVFNESKGVTEFEFIYGEGIDKFSSLKSGLDSLNFLKRGGSYYSFSDEIREIIDLPSSKFQGSSKLIEWLKENPEQAQLLYDHALSTMLNS